MNSETLLLKRDLIRAGINAWISAMPTPASTALRISSAAESRNRREAVARPMISSDSTTVRCSPKRWLMFVPKSIASPMAITGSMVRSEARLKLSGISLRMLDSSGPTAAIDGRRFSATRITAIISQRAVRGVVRGVVRTFSMTRP
ncbi:hypothetical protein D3C71_1706720 [compost metagenome]